MGDLLITTEDDGSKWVQLEDYETLKQIAIDNKLIVEHYQKLLGVYTNTEAFTRIVEIKEFIQKIRDGGHHYKNHPDEPCRCNEDAAGQFLANWYQSKP